MAVSICTFFSIELGINKLTTFFKVFSWKYYNNNNILYFFREKIDMFGPMPQTESKVNYESSAFPIIIRVWKNSEPLNQNKISEPSKPYNMFLESMPIATFSFKITTIPFVTIKSGLAPNREKSWFIPLKIQNVGVF